MVVILDFETNVCLELFEEEVNFVVNQLVNVDEGGHSSALVGVNLETEFVPSIEVEMSNVCELKSIQFGQNSDFSWIIVPVLINFPADLQVSTVVKADFVELVIEGADFTSGSVDTRTVDSHIVGVLLHEKLLFSSHL